MVQNDGRIEEKKREERRPYKKLELGPGMVLFFWACGERREQVKRPVNLAGCWGGRGRSWGFFCERGGVSAGTRCCPFVERTPYWYSIESKKRRRLVGPLSEH